LTIDDIKISYWDEGQGQDIVLLHGIGSSAENWAWLMPYLTNQFRLLAPDLPGFGQSDFPANIKQGTQIDRAAEILRQMIDGFGLHQPIIVGHSMGAGIALEYARRHPNACRGLVLISSMGFGKEIDLTSRMLALPLVGKLLFHPTRAIIAQGMASIFHQPVPEQERLVDITYRYFQRPRAKDYHLALLRSGLNLAGQQYQFTFEGLQQLEIPIMIIWGGHDQLFPITHAYHSHQLLPQAQLHILSDVGHNPPIEAPSQVANLIIDFMNST